MDTMEGLPDGRLLVLTKVVSRFQQLAALIYLIHQMIIIPEGACHVVHLCNQVPPPAILLLSSISLSQKVTLMCNLYFLIQYEDALSLFCLKTLVVMEVSVLITGSKLSLLALP